MNWIRATILTTTPGAEALSGALMDLGIEGAAIEDRADIASSQRPEGQWDIIDAGLIERMGEDVKLTVYFPADERANDTLAAIKSALGALGAMDLGFDMGKLTLDVGQIDEEDWSANWKAHYKPFRLGRHFVVCPSWLEFDARPDDKVLSIDPGMAFGTGAHETTALCIELIEAHVRPGDMLIDVGTGSGILAMAAALCGASRVLATDLDATAVRVARENVLKAGMADVIDIRQGDLLSAVDGVADVAVANIIADVIIALAQPIRAHIREGGLFICSGIIAARLDDVLAALDAAGYQKPEAVRTMGEWAAIALRR